MTRRKGYKPRVNPYENRVAFLAKHRDRLARDLGITIPGQTIPGKNQAMLALELLKNPDLGDTLRSKALLLRVLHDAIGAYIEQTRIYRRNPTC